MLFFTLVPAFAHFFTATAIAAWSVVVWVVCEFSCFSIPDSGNPALAVSIMFATAGIGWAAGRKAHWPSKLTVVLMGAFVGGLVGLSVGKADMPAKFQRSPEMTSQVNF